GSHRTCARRNGGGAHVSPALRERLADLAVDMAAAAPEGDGAPITVEAEVTRAAAGVLLMLAAVAPRARSGLEVKAMVAIALGQLLRVELDARLPAVAT
ncbi:MAG: hypothetical protein ACRENE_12295, partial [Polyangiaceae bacterium]